MKNIVAIQTIITLFILVNIVMLMTVFGPCNGISMPCNHTTTIVIFIMGAMIVSSASSLFSYGRIRIYTVLVTIIMLLDAAAMIITCVLGGCMKMEMRCHTYTFPYIFVSGVLVLIFQAIAMLFIRKPNKEQP